MDEPIKASQIEKVDEDRSPEEIEKAKVKRAVASRRARREALKGAGVENVGSPALAENIEAGLGKIDRSTTTRFRASKAAQQAVANKRRQRAN